MMYQVCGYVVDSDIPLSGVAPAINKDCDVLFQLTSSAETFLEPSRWLIQRHLPNGEPWFSAAQVDGGYLLRFHELADFSVNDCGKRVICRPKPGLPLETIHHLLLDQIIPLVINLKGREALHASAVFTSHGVVAFTGLTGSGKSTLAAGFVGAGYPLMSDDCLALLDQREEIYGMPAYPGLRLYGDGLSYLFGDNGAHEPVAHYTAKRRVDIKKRAGAYCTEPQPLRRLYVIAGSSQAEEDRKILIEPLSSQDCFIALVRCAFRLDITDRSMLTRQFRFLERVASCVSARRLSYPRDFKLVPAIREAVLNDLENSNI